MKAKTKMKEMFHLIVWKMKKDLYKRKESNVGASYCLSHVTYYAVGNTGDTVLSQCVRRFFEYCKEDIGWNIISLDLPVTEETVDNINHTNALIIGGGGLFLPDTNKNSISGWQWAVSKKQLEEISSPVIVFAVGYNNFKGQYDSEFFKDNLIELCKKSSFFGLRNHGSVNKIKGILPASLQDKVVYQPCITTLIRKLYGAEIPPKVSTRNVAINMAFDREDKRYGSTENEQLICSKVAQAAKLISDLGYHITLLYHCQSDDKIQPYMDQYNVKYSEVDITFDFPSEVYSVYNKFECVLGMRGHAQMIPFGLNCKIISLGTHDKMRWFLEDIDAVDWYIDLTEHSELLDQIIFERFKKICVEEKELTERRLLEAQDKLWELSINNMNEIMKKL
ncbi:MAG: polysaccharide pyruvyl transferase family protein [Bacteroides thetaiotaomicron]|nr:polysaccharide pyruvyl transferase family protein [Bacteroides thetaiotaomicron]